MKIHPRLVPEHGRRQSEAGRYNPASVALVRYNKRLYSLVLGCGTSDDNYFWRDGRHVDHLAVNEGLGYCGLTRYELGDTPYSYSGKPNHFDADEVGSVFCQADWEVADALGPRGLELDAATIRRRLAERIQ